MVDRIRSLCAGRGMSLAALEKELGFANGSLAKTDEKTQSGRIKAIADFFGVSMEYILTGNSGYYLNDETASLAQELFDDTKYRILMSSSRKLSPEDLETIQTMVDALLRKEGKDV